MGYWQNDFVSTALSIVVLLLSAEVLRHYVAPLRRLGIPGSIIAGVVGLLLGPDLLEALPLHRDVLETLVYHGLAVVFIAVGLQPPERLKGHVAGGVRSFTFGIPFMQVLQTFVGLGAVLVLGLLLGRVLHPGLGVLLPLGFEEGPGQALSLGAAWEEAGMRDGAQIGLIIAAVGFAWSVVIGLPLVVWGRRRGLVSSFSTESVRPVGEAEPRLPAGALDPLTRQLAAVAGCYAVTYGICRGLSHLFAGLPTIAATIWGFHFIFGAGVAMAVRPLLARLRGGSPLHGPTLARISGLSVDVMTCAALAAVQIAVLRSNWLPILLVTSLGGLITLGACLWFTSRAFPDAPFEHCVVWYGMSTGTLPLGLALLRVVDPDLRSPAPLSAVLGSAGAVVFALPLWLFLIPGTVASWPVHYPVGGWLGWVLSLAYIVVLLVLWRKLAPLRFYRPWSRLWHPGAEPAGPSGR